MTPFAYSRVFAQPFELHLAFFRDVAPDVEFACRLFEERRGRKATGLAELQCGPAYYAQCAARRGLRAWAVDTRQDFLDFARARAPELGVEYRCADPRALTGLEGADLVLLPLDSFAYLLSDEDVLRFFEAAAGCMASDGLLLVEANHPKDVGYIDYGTIYGGKAPDFPGSRVRAEWGVNHPRFDLVTGRVQTQIRLTLEHEGRQDRRVIDSQEKLWFAREVELLSQRGPLRLAGVFGGYQPKRITWDDAVQVFAFERAPRG